MKILFDTSVLIAALVENHPNPKSAFPWLQKAKDKTSTGIVSAHTIAELYNVLTILPIRPRIAPTAAIRAIQRDVLEQFEVVALARADYIATIEHLAKLNIIGGATFDALIMRATAKAHADQLITFNISDFRRVYPELAGKIISP
jgi:predicted nucleic acid-binding protein